MRDDLRDLARLDTTIECSVHVEGQFDALVARDQNGQGDDAAIAPGETRSFPNLTEKALLRIPVKGWSNCAELF